MAKLTSLLVAALTLSSLLSFRVAPASATTHLGSAIFSGYLVESDEGLFDDLSFQINDVSNGRSLFYTRLGDDMRSALAAGHYSTHIGPPVCCGASGNIDGAFIEFEFTFAPSR